jgi:DNA-binding CsgD family transcriptional regulator
VRMGISANMVEKHINTGMLACKNCPYARED